MDAAALCLSGGGIRSAAFALGIIQALASHPRPNPKEARPVASAGQSLLSKFHYVSTVSGGGDIGSWLSTWLINQPYSEVWRALSGRPSGPSKEPTFIAWLRSYSNYLTPKVGLTSADTWAALAMWMRNLLLNWFVILPPVCLFILLVKLVGVSSTWLIIWGESPDAGGQYDIALVTKIAGEIGAGVCAIVALILALRFTLRGRPGWKQPGDGPDQRQFVWRSLFWSMLFAFLLVLFFASDLVGLSLLQCKGAPIKLPYWPTAICQEVDKPPNAWLTARPRIHFNDSPHARARRAAAVATRINKAIAKQPPFSVSWNKSLLQKNVYASAIGLCRDSIMMQSSKPSNSDF